MDHDSRNFRADQRPDPAEIRQEKEQLRNRSLEKLRFIDAQSALAAAFGFTEGVLESEAYRSADSVFIYISIKNEPSTERIIRHAIACGKKVYVPKCLLNHEMAAVRIGPDTRFLLNRYAIPEPVEDTERAVANEIDLCVIPCIAAAPDGRRLGHGGGYYDRFLSGADTYKLCLCYEINLMDTIPSDEFDILMDAIQTEKRTVVCK